MMQIYLYGLSSRVKSFILAAALGLTAALYGTASRALELPLPPEDQQVVGELRIAVVGDDETLLDIARRYDVGYNEIVAANPGMDPWLPKPGREIVVPTRFVLPDAPREGVIVNLPEMRLYYFPKPVAGKKPVVITHPVGIGSEGRAMPRMSAKIGDKRANPVWNVPESIRQEHAAEGDFLPARVPPGPDNPLGAFAMRIGGTSFLIHGTNKPFSVGMRTTHGCIRLYPEDIASLFPKVPAGTPIQVVDQPYKAGWLLGDLYLEAHSPLSDVTLDADTNLTPMVRAVSASSDRRAKDAVWHRAQMVVSMSSGLPTMIGRGDLDFESDAARPAQLSLPPAPHPLATMPPAAGKSSPNWALQMGAFRSEKSIKKLSADLARFGFPHWASAAQDEPLCRVLVGPYASQTEAENAARSIHQRLGMTGVIISSLTVQLRQNKDGCALAQAQPSPSRSGKPPLAVIDSQLN